MSDMDHTRGLLDARRGFAEVWRSVTGQSIHEVDFSAAYFSDLLRSRWFERRTMADGVAPAVGQRVVTVLEVAERWHLGHAHDALVHEITSLLSGDTHLVECGPKQIGVGMLRIAPEGSVVTCLQCLGWREQREKWRIDALVYRAEQFNRDLLRGALQELIERFAPTEDGLGEAEIACANRAREALARTV